MLKKSVVTFLFCLVLAACSSDAPLVVQPSANMPELRLKNGLAAQIQMPGEEHVESAVTGDPTLVTVDAADTVVNLIPKKKGSGETNLIVRSVDQDGQARVYQYRVVVLPQ